MSEATEEKGKQEVEGETIEAGYVGELEDLPFHEARHRAETARRLAFLLVWILAISVGLHYIATATLGSMGKGRYR
jgi:hypothetical protein